MGRLNKENPRKVGLEMRAFEIPGVLEGRIWKCACHFPMRLHVETGKIQYLNTDMSALERKWEDVGDQVKCYHKFFVEPDAEPWDEPKKPDVIEQWCGFSISKDGSTVSSGWTSRKSLMDQYQFAECRKIHVSDCKIIKTEPVRDWK